MDQVPVAPRHTVPEERKGMCSGLNMVSVDVELKRLIIITPPLLKDLTVLAYTSHEPSLIAFDIALSHTRSSMSSDQPSGPAGASDGAASGPPSMQINAAEMILPYMLA
jgi:hypothetical protein